MEGYIYTKNEYIIVEYMNRICVSKAPVCLKEIKKVISWDTEGYFVLDTNYGEEYLDMGYILSEELGLNKEKFQSDMEQITEFKIKTSKSKVGGVPKMKPQGALEKIITEAYLIVDSLAYTINVKNNISFIGVTDLSNANSRAVFKVNADEFELCSSSFKEGKRKYMMLYILEKNKNLLLEGVQNAKVF